jgi:acetyl esterase/lipase
LNYIGERKRLAKLLSYVLKRGVKTALSCARYLLIALLALGGSHASAIDVQSFLGNSLACLLLENELADVNIAPLQQINSEGQCVAVVPDEEAGSWFSDAQCTSPIVYTQTTVPEFCAGAANAGTLGNGVGIRQDAWTLTPGNRLDLGARSLSGVTQPYMQRLVYRRVQTPRGACDLEMRVYKKHPGDTGQKSLVALHGGSWSARSFGFMGLELSVPHFVDQGFVVYAPFYRLLDNEESTAACNQADFSDVVNDAEFALDWVISNAADFGSSGAPIVFGQSAGGHLGLSLVVNRTASVSGAVLMYPPTDFSDFLQRIQSGAYTNEQGLSILEDVLGTGATAATADPSLPVVVNNSFPQRVASEGLNWPPVFIVQGSADELVEARQSVRLCDALAGRILPGVAEEVGLVSEQREVVTCDATTTPNSTMHLIKLGAHALDVCLNENVSDLCPAGNATSRALISQSIVESVNFASTAFDGHNTQPDDSENQPNKPESSRSSGGGIHWFLISLLVLWQSRWAGILSTHHS